MLTAITTVLGLAAVCACILAGLVAAIYYDGGEPEPPGADEDYAAEVHRMAEPAAHAGPLTAETPAVYVSRHHEDTVAIVAGEYRPRYNRAYAALVGYDRRELAA